MKTKILMLCVLLCLAAGCQNIKQIQEAVSVTQKNVGLLNDTIDALRTELAENPTLTSEEKAAITTKLDKAVEIKVIAEDQLVFLQQELERAMEAGVGGQIEAGGNVVQRLSNVLPPPFNGVGALIGIILTSAGGAYAKREQRKRKVGESVLKDVIGSVDAFLGDADTAELTAKKAKELLAGAQDHSTREAVRKIKNGG